MAKKLTCDGVCFSAKFVVAMILLLLAIPVFAQVPTATVLGTIKDSSGAVVPGATVTIQNVDTNATRTTTTADDGSYRVPALNVGNYTVKAEKSGFGTQTQQGITLTVDQNAVINFTLTVGAAVQTVTVTTEAPVVNTTNGELGGLVNEQQMAELPLNGRNYLDLSLMQAGVTEDKNFGGGGGQQGTSYSANGATVRSNNFTLDGAPTTTIYGRNPSTQSGDTMGVDGIKEYKVITNNFAAEYGMTMGSQLVMVSKNGTNQFHGDVFEYVRNAALNARNFFDYGYLQPGGRRVPGFQRNNFGGSFGGPIRKDKTFVYAVYEGLRQNQPQTNILVVPAAACKGPAGATIVGDPNNSATCTQLVASATTPGCSVVSGVSSCTISSQVAPLLNNPILFPTANVGSTTFTFPSSNRDSENYGQMRVDENFSDKDTGFVRYTIGNGFQDNTSGYCCRATSPSRNQFVSLVESHIFSTSLLNTARGSVSRTNFHQTNTVPTALIGPTLSMIPGLPTGTIQLGGSFTAEGAPAGIPAYGVQNIITGSDDVSYTRGKHAFKFGTLYNHYEMGIQQNMAVNGRLNFGGLSKFLVGIPSLFEYQALGGNQNRDFTWNTFGFYGQDDYRATSRLTINMGLRYEFMTTATEKFGRQDRFENFLSSPSYTFGPVMRDRTHLNFSPRVGFAWDVFGNGKTSVRGGAGIYYDLANIGMNLEQSALSMPPYSGQVDIPNSTKQFAIPLSGLLDVNSAFAAGIIAAQGVDYNAYRPDLWVYNLAIERQLPGGTSLSVAYAGSRGAHLWMITDAEPATPIVVNGTRYWSSASVIPNTAIGSTTTNVTNGASWYNSLQVVVNKRLSRGLQFGVAYTYALLEDETQGQEDVSDCSNAPAPGLEGVDPLHPLTDKGPACFDVKHNLRFNLIYHLPNMKSNGIVSKLASGWWIGNIVSVQSGYAFTPVESIQRSNSGVLQGQLEWTNFQRFYVPPGATDPNGQTNNTTTTFKPFNRKSVIEGTTAQWFDPTMFSLQPTYYSGFSGAAGTFPVISGCGTVIPAKPSGGCFWGQLGDTGRDILRGPGFGNWDFSIVKDTAIHALGEQGSLEFRAEMFNVLNHRNLGMPSASTYSGDPTDYGSYFENPSSGVGQITKTSNANRQLQFALKLLF